jgi:prepilin-type N-terminal cleavage/methylation domain-containing protein
MKKQAGFSLVEILIVILLSALILSAVSGVFVTQAKTYKMQELVIDTLQNSRQTMAMMTKEIRLAGYKTPESTLVGVAQADATTLRILSDRNQDGAISGSSEDVTYRYDANNLKILRNNNLLLDNVELLDFVYTLDDGSTTQTPANLAKIRKIKLTIRVRSSSVDPLSQNFKTYELTSEITPRNLSL